MLSVPESQTTYKPVAMYATLDYKDHGVALRQANGQVFFCDDATGQWRELCDRDMARVQLHGRLDLIKIAEIVDGNLVLKASKTVQRVAA